MKTINLNDFIKCKDHDGYKAQSVKELQWGLTMEQFELVYCMTPDGQSDDFSWKIRLTNWFTGEEYVLKTVILGHIRSETYEDEDCTWYENGRTRAEALIQKMKDKGVINLDNWCQIK